MSDQYGGEVRYTVKELLDQMRKEQHAAHLELVGKVDGVKRDVRELSRRVDELEDERLRRVAVAILGSRAWVGVIAALGIIVNIPAMIYFLTGAH